MRTAQKWDFEKRKYETVEISDNCSTFEFGLERKVECPGCGKMITYGEKYTSRQYYTDYGLGFCVCSDCKEKEWEEELQYKKEKYE